MKNLLLVFILLLGTLQVLADEKIKIEIIKITDGDTVKAKLENNNKFSIRLQGIDCAESYTNNRAYKQAYQENQSIDEIVKNGLNVKKYLTNLHKNTKNVSFIFRGIDKYGRVLGVLYFDKTNINQKLIDDGLCKPYIYKEK